MASPSKWVVFGIIHSLPDRVGTLQGDLRDLIRDPNPTRGKTQQSGAQT